MDKKVFFCILGWAGITLYLFFYNINPSWTLLVLALICFLIAIILSKKDEKDKKTIKETEDE